MFKNVCQNKNSYNKKNGAGMLQTAVSLAIALFQCKIEKNEVTHVFIAKAIYLVSIVSKCAAFAIVSLLFYFTQVVSFHLLQLATTVCRTLSDFFCIFMLIFPHHTLDCSINIF